MLRIVYFCVKGNIYNTMKFELWLEEKETRKIMYHGTSSKLLSRIMSEGLIPSPKKRSWGSDPDSSFDNPSRISYGGIYVTTNLLTAQSAGFRTAQSTKGNTLIVCMDIHPYSLIDDEDNVTFTVKSLTIPGLLTTEFTLSQVYATWVVLQDKEFIKNIDKHYIDEQKQYLLKIKDNYVETTLKRLMYKIDVSEQHPRMIAAVKSLLENQGFSAILVRHAAYVNQEYLDRAFKYFGYNGDVKAPDKEFAERVYMKFIDQLTRTFKKNTFPRASKNNFLGSGRLEKSIGFVGKDRIVCIFEEWYRQGVGTFVYVHYGEPPHQLLSDWKRHIGEWRRVDQIPG